MRIIADAKANGRPLQAAARFSTFPGSLACSSGGAEPGRRELTGAEPQRRRSAAFFVRAPCFRLLRGRHDAEVQRQSTAAEGLGTAEMSNAASRNVSVM